MIKIFVDTSVWRHWFDWKAGKSFEKHPKIKADVEAFDEIHALVSSQPQQLKLLYSWTVERELGSLYAARFAKIKQAEFTESIPDGPTRWDGARKYGEGTYGYVPYYEALGVKTEADTLRVILSMYGHNHEDALQKAKPDHKTPNPLHTKERRKEFDIELIEGVLTVADMFLATNYGNLLGRLQEAVKYFPEHKAVREARRICMRPVDALSRLLQSQADLGAATRHP